MWKEDCNSCRCSKSGHKACTRKICIPEEITGNDAQRMRRQLQIQESSTQRNRNSPKKVSFNLEVSTSTQSPAITPNKLEPTQSSTTKPILSTRRPTYERGTADRIVTADELKDPAFRCEPSLSFKLDCNTCWCAADGKGARYCTRIVCHPKTYPPLDKQ